MKSAKNLKGERPFGWKTTFKLVYSPFSEKKKGIAKKWKICMQKSALLGNGIEVVGISFPM